MSNLTIQNKMYIALKSFYPKAVRECELYEIALRDVRYTQRDSKVGGTYMRDLCKRGLARKLDTGYYVAVAPFQNLEDVVQPQAIHLRKKAA